MKSTAVVAVSTVVMFTPCIFAWSKEAGGASLHCRVSLNCARDDGDGDRHDTVFVLLASVCPSLFLTLVCFRIPSLSLSLFILFIFSFFLQLFSLLFYYFFKATFLRIHCVWRQTALNKTRKQNENGPDEKSGPISLPHVHSFIAVFFSLSKMDILRFECDTVKRSNKKRKASARLLLYMSIILGK